MFAQLKGTAMEYSVNDKLREIDVANENVHGSTDYTGKVSFFKCSAAYGKITRFIQRLNGAVQGRTTLQLRGENPQAAAAETTRKVQIFASDAAVAAQQPAADASSAAATSDAAAAAPAAPSVEPTPASLLALEKLLAEVEALISECPPEDKSVTIAAPPSAAGGAVAEGSISSAPASSRFGSPAFRDFLTLLQQRSGAMLDRVLDAVPEAERGGWALVDAVQSEQSAAWEKEGHETLRKFKLEHAHETHQHTHHAHKLPPGVVISHGPSGVNNGPSLQPQAQEGKQEHAHAEGDHKHADGGCCGGHDAGAAASSSSAASAVAAASAAESQRARVVHHLSRYLVQSWGDIRRLDYGTGHELHFLCLLSCLGDVGVFSLTSDLHVQRLVGRVFVRYVKLMRRLQTTYLLEPAGSRGVWGLDDFAFVPFLLGSSQLVGHKHIKPKSVRYPDVLDGFSEQYLYLDCIRFILSVKTCSFAEHSPMLNDITVIRAWGQVNDGLWKMYLAEVLGKFAVVQHFIYSPFLPAWPVQPLQVQEVKEEAPCCGDAIHFPSAIGAAKAAVQPPRL